MCLQSEEELPGELSTFSVASRYFQHLAQAEARLLWILWRSLRLTAPRGSYIEVEYSQHAEVDKYLLGGASPVNAHGGVIHDLSEHVAVAMTGARTHACRRVRSATTSPGRL